MVYFTMPLTTLPTATLPTATLPSPKNGVNNPHWSTAVTRLR
jgi:hypothetical protein